MNEPALTALARYVADHPGTPLNEVMAHFFPPSPHPFSRNDLSVALVDGLYRGTLTLDTERRLSSKTPVMSDDSWRASLLRPLPGPADPNAIATQRAESTVPTPENPSHIDGAGEAT